MASPRCLSPAEHKTVTHTVLTHGVGRVVALGPSHDTIGRALMGKRLQAGSILALQHACEVLAGRGVSVSSTPNEATQ